MFSRNDFDGDKPPLADRLRAAFLKPPKPGEAPEAALPQTVEELEQISRKANDKERLIGLFAAPFAAAIGLLVTSSLIANDPAARLKDGLPNRLHVSVSLYHELMLALIVLAMLMLAFAWFRKRLYLGMVMALYGLAIFNLRFWGFGVPYVLAGAWYIVRSYRFQRAYKEASGAAPSRFNRATGTGPVGRRASANKRYTPPVTRPRN